MGKGKLQYRCQRQMNVPQCLDHCRLAVLRRLAPLKLDPQDFEMLESVNEPGLPGWAG